MSCYLFVNFENKSRTTCSRFLQSCRFIGDEAVKLQTHDTTTHTSDTRVHNTEAKRREEEMNRDEERQRCKVDTNEKREEVKERRERLKEKREEKGRREFSRASEVHR